MRPGGASSRAARRPGEARLLRDRRAPGSRRRVSFGRAARSGQLSPAGPPRLGPSASCRLPPFPVRVRTCAGPPSPSPRSGDAGTSGPRAGAGASPPRAPSRLLAPAPARRCLRCVAARARPPMPPPPRLPPPPRPGATQPGAANKAHVPARAARGSTAAAAGGSREGGAGAGARELRAPPIELRPRPARAPGELARGGTGRRIAGWVSGPRGIWLQPLPVPRGLICFAGAQARGIEALSPRGRVQGRGAGVGGEGDPPPPPAYPQ